MPGEVEELSYEQVEKGERRALLRELLERDQGIGEEFKHVRHRLLCRERLVDEFDERARRRQRLQAPADALEAPADDGFLELQEFGARFGADAPFRSREEVKTSPEAPRLNGITRECGDFALLFGERGHDPVAILVRHHAQDDG
jgi:hypothetical protein